MIFLAIGQQMFQTNRVEAAMDFLRNWRLKCFLVFLWDKRHFHLLKSDLNFSLHLTLLNWIRLLKKILKWTYVLFWRWRFLGTEDQNNVWFEVQRLNTSKPHVAHDCKNLHSSNWSTPYWLSLEQNNPLMVWNLFRNRENFTNQSSDRTSRTAPPCLSWFFLPSSGQYENKQQSIHPRFD